jgi:hypothetical protein
MWPRPRPIALHLNSAPSRVYHMTHQSHNSPYLPSSEASTRPIFIRLPRAKTRCSYTGLSRTSLNELVVPCAANDFAPPVRSYVKKKRGAARGIRLVDLGSLLSYLRSLSTGGTSVGHGESPSLFNPDKELNSNSVPPSAVERGQPIGSTKPASFAANVAGGAS